MASIVEQESNDINCDSNNSHSNTWERRRRRLGLHSECSSTNNKTLVAVAVAVAALVCLSSPDATIASSRHIPPTRHVVSNAQSSRPQSNRFRFLTPRNNNQKLPPSPVAPAPPLKASSASSSRLQFSASPEDANAKANEIPSPSLNNSTLSSTSITTTSFFRSPSEITKQLEGTTPGPRWLRQTPQASIRLQQHRPTQAQIQTTFVVSLMGLAGFVEGFCIRRHGCFPNLMTGTILKVAEAVGNLNFSAAAIHASMVGCYIGGGFVFSLWKKTAVVTADKNQQKKSSLTAISVLSAVCLLLSDAIGRTSLSSFRLPLLAAAYGIINAGTVDVGAGVTYAMTGHVTKVGQGLATGKLSKPGDPSAKPSAHRTSAQGLAVFSVAALVANLVCGLLDRSGKATTGALVAWPLEVARMVLSKLPLGTTLVVVYAWLFRWYVGASAKASSAEAKMQ